MDVPPDHSLSRMHPDTTPPDYPEDLESWVTLDDATQAFVRPIVPQDEARVRNAMEFGDGDTIRRRFLSAAPPDLPRHVRYLVEVDYRWRLALLAMDAAGNSVALARYEGSKGSDSAEVAIVVEPTWRRRGLASLLLESLEAPAIASGVSDFVAVYQPDNRAIAAVLAALGYGDGVLDGGLTRVSKTLR